MIALFVLLAVLIGAYVGWSRRRHGRLKAACTAAFDRCYAGASPRPGFEMSYSYGEPVFLAQFASKADATAADAANTAFLREIDALCKDRGRKRQFKAQRSVFFRYPQDPDEVRVVHCCDAMRAQLGRAVLYSDDTQEYGLRTSELGVPPLVITHCPWCGSALNRAQTKSRTR